VYVSVIVIVSVIVFKIQEYFTERNYIKGNTQLWDILWWLI